MPITLKAQNKHLAILSSISGCVPNISISASYVTIEDMRIVVDPSDAICGGSIAGVNSASGTGVRCWEQHMARASGPTTTGWVGCTVRGVKIDYSNHRGHAIKVNQDGVLIENNDLAGGLECFGGLAQVFRNNYVHGPDHWGGGIYCKGEARNAEIYNNTVVVDASLYGGIQWNGLTVGGDSPAQWAFNPGSTVTCWNCVAYNNVILVKGNNKNGFSAIGLGTQGTKNSKLFNNVVIGGRIFSDAASTNDLFQNNVVSCLGDQALLGWGTNTTVTYDYNNFYNCTGAPSQAHPITGDPRFVNPDSDWHLQGGAPALNSGTVVTITGYNGEAIDVSKDKDGLVRTKPWSLGIYAGNSSSTDTAAPAPVSGVRLQ
jgi:hypothetical protein